MAEILEGFPERLTAGSLDLHSLQVNPQNTMNMGSSPSLELNSVTYMADTQWAAGAKDNLLFEHFHAMLEIPGG